MNLVNRKVTYRLYPTAKQEALLCQTVRLHQQLYNAALEQRINAYRSKKVSVSFSIQCKELTELRREFPEYAGLNAQSAQVTLKRLDLAYQHFFRRVQRGEAKAGFPRFKSRDRFSGFGFKTHGDGWKLITADNKPHGQLRLSGIGLIKIRGKARQVGMAKTLEVQHKQGRWYASVTFVASPKRTGGTVALGLDWGVSTFATIRTSDGITHEIANPRHLKKQLMHLKAKQQALSRKKKGSKNCRKAKVQIAKLHAKVANQRKEFLHQSSASLVKKAALISVEALNVKGMTTNGGAYKKGLNREILNTAPAAFYQMLQYKAEEAGVEWIEVPTRKVKPSQTCHQCGRQEKKSLATRIHVCPCGITCGRDDNSARVNLNWALLGRASGWEPARCGAEGLPSAAKHETPSIAAL